MLNLDGRIFVTIKVDGHDLPHSPGLIERITMTEGGGALSPAIELILNDYANSLSKELALTDGNELLITVGKTVSDINTQSRKYRVFGIRTLPTPMGPRMQVIGIYDAPGYLTGSMRESFRGTTGDVIKTIASRCGLSYYGPETFNGAKTNDNQVWLNVAKSRAMFVQQTSRHGYIDDHSAMMCVLTSLGQLRYLNLNDVIETPKEKIKRMFAHNTFKSDDPKLVTYPVREARTRSSAGLMNTWQNYGSTRVEHSLDGEKISHTKVDVQTSADYLPINNVVKKQVARSRLEYSPLDCGNTHDNFTRAQYQNLKLLALFSEHVSILTYDVTDLQPLDVVIYRQANSDPKVPVSNSDIYLVVAKSIVVKSANYAERIELVRHNIVEKGATELAAFEGASTSVADSTIPNSIIDPTSNVGATALPKAQSLNDLTKPTEASMNQMKGSVSDMRKGAGFLKPTLKGIHETLQGIQKNKALAHNLVGQMRNSISAMKHFSSIGKNYTNMMKYSVGNLRNLRTALEPRNLSAGMRSALMFKKGGGLNAMTYNLGVVRQNMQLSSMLRPLNYQINSNMSSIRNVTNGEHVANEFLRYSNEIIGNNTLMRVQTNHMWNESTSILHGKSVPDPSKINLANSSRMTNVMSDLYRAPASGSYVTVPLDVATQDLGNSMMLRSPDRQPNWIHPDAEWDYSTSVTKERAAYGAGYDDSLKCAYNAFNAMEADEEAADARESDESGG